LAASLNNRFVGHFLDYDYRRESAIASCDAHCFADKFAGSRYITANASFRMVGR